MKFFITLTFLLLTVNISWGITINHNKVDDPQVIGGAYNSKGEFFLPGIRCLEFDKGDVSQFFNNRTTVDYNEVSTSLELDSQFGFGFEFALKPPSGDTYGLSMDWMRTLSESNIDALATYKTEVFLGSEILRGPFKLTEEALILSKEDPESFNELCGDSFVTRVNKGATGEVLVKIEVDGYSDKKEFMADLSLGFLNYGDFGATLSKLKEKNDIKFKVTISGKQEGGFTANINSIFGDALKKCSSDSLSECRTILSDITAYFSGKFVTQFEPYYRDDNGSGVIPLPVTGAPLSYITTSYCNLGRMAPPHLNCHEKVDNSQEFQILEDKKNEYLNEINRLKDFAINLDRVLAPDYFKLMKIYTGRMQSNLDKIKKTRINCLKDKWNCKSDVKGFMESIYPIQLETTSVIESDDRIEFCFKSGKKVEISGFSIRALNGDQRYKTYTSYSKPLVSDWDCYLFKAPELNEEEFDGLEISVRTKGEDLGECKIRAVKKFSSWADWDLEKIRVRHYRSGIHKTFDGRRYKHKKKCKRDQDSRYPLKWVKLKPLL